MHHTLATTFLYYFTWISVTVIIFILFFSCAVQSPPDPGKVWKNCLMKCGEVLHQCAEVLGGCKNDEDGLTLLSEVATSEEGQNKLKGGAEC